MGYPIPFEIQKIRASTAENDAYFGMAVSISGDYVIVGSPS